VQTHDNAEIVIPNSDLITGQVTNWTLAERRIRVKISVGVAYGTDTTKVLKILLDCADESPIVLSKPAPSALFLCFGESSLDFELRVWIAEFNDRRVVQSELNQDINHELKTAGIKIPFPQRDLYIRNIDDDPTPKKWSPS
ncbi:MAG: mechanosensitive ion channel, partial [Desulfobacterales bacterium]|nr:mechanosensitive ion channel [Desulfobacterales bacterium]